MQLAISKITAACLFFCFGIFVTPSLGAQNEIVDSPNKNVNADNVSSDSNRIGYLVQIPLPINSEVSSKVRQTLQRIAEKSSAVVRPEDRAVVVLQFDTSLGQSGRGSELEACQALARYLDDAELNQIETVPTFLPGVNSSRSPKANQNRSSMVMPCWSLSPQTSWHSNQTPQLVWQDSMRKIFNRFSKQFTTA